jgi:hypothetical protein
MISSDQLFSLVGSWAGSEELFATAWTEPGRSEASIELTPGPDGALLIDYAAQHQDSSLTAHGVVAAGGWWWFDSYGFVPTTPGTASWRDGRLVLERTSERGRNVTTLALVDGRLEQRIQTAVPPDAELRLLMQGTYTRQ